MPQKGFSHDMFDTFNKIPGFIGPYRNQYLRGEALGAGSKHFTSLEEAIQAAHLNNRCGGITVTRQGIYTLRRKSQLYESDLKSKFKSIEITYIKQDKKPEELPPKIRTQPYIIEECKTKHKSEDDIYEVIIYGNREYYYNIKTRNMLDMEGNLVGVLVRGKLQLN